VLGFGQPLGAVVQFAYVVEDIDRAMSDFTERLGIGPWFVRERFCPPAGRYRGEPTSPLFSLARAFAGHAMVELIEQHDDTLSVYHEHEGPRRYGFHHWGVMTDAFEEDVARYRALGYDEAFTDTLPSGSRVAYMDATGDLPGMIELIEHTEGQERLYTEIYAAAVDWDGSEPVRRG
jgi:glyoxalase/bleomycin resistance protein/dioxygenase superfamily protein